jgi:hypothetical protein
MIVLATAHAAFVQILSTGKGQIILGETEDIVRDGIRDWLTDNGVAIPSGMTFEEYYTDHDASAGVMVWWSDAPPIVKEP